MHIFYNPSLSVVHILDQCVYINLKFLYFREENCIIQVNPNAVSKNRSALFGKPSARFLSKKWHFIHIR